ncbi:hypothetical protein L4C31_00825 [Aliivibrio sifiae]
MQLKQSLKEAELKLGKEALKQTQDLNRRLHFGTLTTTLGYPKIKYDEIIGTSLTDKILLLSTKRIEQYGDSNVTPEMAEDDFLRLMDRFRVIGNRNIYGNNCTVFTPPSGYRYNEEVSNTYYAMYDGALNGSEAFNLLNIMVEKSVDYVIGGGTKNMLEWIVEVGVAMAYQEWEHEILDPEDVLEPTLTYLANQSYQSPFFVAYVFG